MSDNYGGKETNMQQSDSTNDPGQVRHQISPLTPEEQRTLKECNSESFYYRCVPLGVVFIGTTQILVNKGFLKPNPRVGALYKNFGAGLLAFLLGKISYQGACREKILKLENSPLAESMRHGKRGPEIMQDILQKRATQDFQQPRYEPKKGREGLNSMEQRRSDFSGDGKTYEYKGLDDSKRPSVDREKSLYDRNKQDDKTTPRPSLSYDELRTQNRKEYERKQQALQSSPEQSRSPPQQYKPSREGESEFDADPRSSRRNKYGDLIEK